MGGIFFFSSFGLGSRREYLFHFVFSSLYLYCITSFFFLSFLYSAVVGLGTACLKLGNIIIAEPWMVIKLKAV